MNDRSLCEIKFLRMIEKAGSQEMFSDKNYFFQ